MRGCVLCKLTVTVNECVVQCLNTVLTSRMACARKKFCSVSLCRRLIPQMRRDHQFDLAKFIMRMACFAFQSSAKRYSSRLLENSEVGDFSHMYAVMLSHAAGWRQSTMCHDLHSKCLLYHCKLK